MQDPDAKGERFLISQGSTKSARFFTDALKQRFPHLKIADGKDEPSKEVIDNSKVSPAAYEHEDAHMAYMTKQAPLGMLIPGALALSQVRYLLQQFRSCQGSQPQFSAKC